MDLEWFNTPQVFKEEYKFVSYHFAHGNCLVVVSYYRNIRVNY